MTTAAFALGGNGHDGDDEMKLCPFSSIASGVPAQGAQGVLGSGFAQRAFDPRTLTQLTELNEKNFDAYGVAKIEAPWCRWYRGPIKLDSSSVGPTELPPEFCSFEPELGERVSVAGDWIIEGARSGTAGREILGGGSEIHEARIIAAVKPDTYLANGSCSPSGGLAAGATAKRCDSPSADGCLRPDTWHLLTSGFFADETAQADTLILRVPIPPATDPLHLTKLEQDVPPLSAGGCMDPLVEVTVACDSIGACTTSLARNGLPNSARACSAIDEACLCEESDLPQHDPARTCTAKGINNYTQFDRCDPAPNTHIPFARDVRVKWVDPDDVWECQCACDDPSSAGSTFEAMVQGCAPGGLEDDVDYERIEACESVCGDTITGLAPYSRIGSCHPSSVPRPAGGRIAFLGCDTSAPISRVTSSGEYMIEVDSSASVARVGSLGLDGTFVDSGSTALSGRVFLNDNALVSPRRLDIANMRLNAADFPVSGGIYGLVPLQISRAMTFQVTRMVAFEDPGSIFRVPSGQVKIGARARIEGASGGLEFVNEGPFFATFDKASGDFSLEGAGSDVEGHVVLVHVQGHVINRPPVALPGEDQVVECQSPTATPVALDGGASIDPDLGDSIAHYQWFAGDTGLSNQQAVTVSASLGAHQYSLHVYDNKLGSHAANHRVSVVDRTGPEIAVAAKPTCLWPPNHEYALFRLGRELQVTVNDQCDPNPTVWIDSVTADEPSLGIGSGNTNPDVVFGTQTACVRAERQGGQNGREYTVVVKARDASCNETTKRVKVVVPHDQSGHPDCQRAEGLEVPDSTCALGPALAVCSSASP